MIHVKAPLTSAYTETPIWWDVLKNFSPPTLGSRMSADIAIVGGGYTGLAAAAEFALAGRSVVVLEANQLGWGASGRNGGIVHPGLNRSLHVARRRRDARQLYQETNDAFALVEKLIDSNGIDCDFEPNGRVIVAHHPVVARRMAKEVSIFEDVLGDKVAFVSSSDLETELRSSAFFGAMVFPISGSLHPAKYLLGLSRLALARGAQVFVNSPAKQIKRHSDGRNAILTPDGEVIAPEVLIATDGYTGRLIPRLSRRVIPINSYIVATEELRTSDAQDVSKQRRAFTDSRNFLSYWRLWGRRLIFGGRTSFRELSLEQARDALYARILDFYPHLEGVRVDYAWQGKVGFTFDRLPHIARVGSVTFAGGYCGSGIAMGTYLGVEAANEIMGVSTSNFSRLNFPTIPGYGGRPWFLPVAGLFYRLKDKRP